MKIEPKMLENAFLRLEPIGDQHREGLRAACNALLSGQPIVADQKPSIGCNIKWATGQEPDYFPGATA